MSNNMLIDEEILKTNYEVQMISHEVSCLQTCLKFSHVLSCSLINIKFTKGPGIAHMKRPGVFHVSNPGGFT